ncbi:MAG: hypothetical protein FH748_03800 [Balneolaceae bacterium]|nr:hypothetical protein [Balneolaceae bacterium]
MNRFLIWITGVIVGAAAGYIVGAITEIMNLITIGVGVILGSTIGITINMQRRKYRKLNINMQPKPGLETEPEAPQGEESTEKSEKQKSSSG